MIHEQFAPASPLVAILSRYDRKTIETVAEISIALLDDLDGDSDREGGFDEEGITDAQARCLDFGPGCPIGDPGEYSDEHTR